MTDDKKRPKIEPFAKSCEAPTEERTIIEFNTIFDMGAEAVKKSTGSYQDYFEAANAKLQATDSEEEKVEIRDKVLNEISGISEKLSEDQKRSNRLAWAAIIITFVFGFVSIGLQLVSTIIQLMSTLL